MRMEQVSFASGEISPLLHARTDLARYRTALAELVNMIVLPQGGITRRGGFSNLGITQNSTDVTYTVKLIPFEYNSTDSELLEFGDWHIRVLRKVNGYYDVACVIDSPYSISEVSDLRYVQSGNVIFLTHRDHKPQILRREGLASWSISELNYRGGPWINGGEWMSGETLEISGSGAYVRVKSSGSEVFDSHMAGTLLKIEYAIDPVMQEIESARATAHLRPGYTVRQELLASGQYGYVYYNKDGERVSAEEAVEYYGRRSAAIGVKGTLNVMTSGEWRGVVSIDRSSDGGETWVTIRQYYRKDTEKQGQWDFTLTEAEADILYRVTATHDQLRTAEEKQTRFNVSAAASIPVLMDYFKGQIMDAGQFRKNSEEEFEADRKANPTYYISAAGADNPEVTQEVIDQVDPALRWRFKRYVESGNSIVEIPTGRTFYYINKGKMSLGFVTYTPIDEAIVDESGNPKVDVAAADISEIGSAIEDSLMYSAADEYITDMLSQLIYDQEVSATATKNDGHDDEAATVTITASGYLKAEELKISRVISGREAEAVRENITLEDNQNLSGKKITLWSMGAWGEVQGYPSTCGMYQDRLVFAGSKYQPQTVWMSRTGDYADFGTSDPLKDDDAVTLTLAGSCADRIHSLMSTGDLLVFTAGGEWKIKGSGDSGAITPTALAAHQQTNIGTKDIQPLSAGGHVILVQSQGRKVYALGYDLNVDGYTGSELSILSGHMFEGRAIVDMAYQKEPDSLLWFVLDDGTCAVCTYNPEHEVIGWSRQELAVGKTKAVCALSDETMTRIFAVCDTGGGSGTQKKMYMSRDRRTESEYKDGQSSYESRMRTLRLNAGGENGSMFTAKKLAARLIISTLRTGKMWAAPGDYSDAHSWERRRKVDAGNTEYLSDAELQLDNGFSNDACIEIRSTEGAGMTIAAITPIVTGGG